MATLYYHPLSSCSRRVVALLGIHGIPAERKQVRLEDGEQRTPAYRAINPNQQVPTWIDDDIRLHESHAILRYLANRHQLYDWYPQAIIPQARVDQWLEWINCRFIRAESMVVFNSCFAGDDANQTEIEHGRRLLEELGDLLDATLQHTDYLTGNQPSLADVSLAASFMQLPLANARSGGAPVEDWYQRMLLLPGMRDIIPSAPATP